MQVNPQKCAILVGHGGIPADCPQELVSRYKRLDAAGKPSPELSALDAKLRSWPRTPETDPYKPGFEAVAEALARKLPGHRVIAAYNEFCAPSLEEALAAAVAQGALEVTVITTMYTRGGFHSEKDIPEILERLRRKHPGVTIRYAWPFDLEAVAGMLAREVGRAESSPAGA